MNTNADLTLWDDRDRAVGTDRGTNPGTKSGTGALQDPPRRRHQRRTERTVMPATIARPTSDSSPIVEPPPLLLTVKQTCHLLGLSRTSLHHLEVSGQLKPIRIGSAVRYVLAKVLEFIESRIADP